MRVVAGSNPAVLTKIETRCCLCTHCKAQVNTNPYRLIPSPIEAGSKLVTPNGAATVVSIETRMLHSREMAHAEGREWAHRDEGVLEMHTDMVLQTVSD